MNFEEAFKDEIRKMAGGPPPSTPPDPEKVKAQASPFKQISSKIMAFHGPKPVPSATTTK